MAGTAWRYVRNDSRKSIAAWLCTKLPELGPTYVKIGQFVSSRRDIFGSELSDGMRDMQDNIPRMTIESVRGTIAACAKLDGAISRLDDVPIASASIAQVHTATLHDGRSVVLKVRRPGLHATIRRDLGLLRGIVNVLDAVGAPEAKHSRRVIEDFVSTLVKETDFRAEIDNIKAFRRLYANRRDVVIPAVHEALCTDDVIVMDNVPSTRVLSYDGDRAILAYRLMSLFLGQVLYRGGIIHGDPQPGNIGVTPEGKIVLYDFGNAIRVSEPYRVRLKLAVFSLVYNNAGDAISALRALGVRVNDEAAAGRYIAMYAKYVRTIDLSVFDIGTDRAMPFALTDRLMRITRVFGLLEGVCKRLDDDFDYLSLAAVSWDAFLLDPDFVAAKGTLDLGRLSQDS